MYGWGNILTLSLPRGGKELGQFCMVEQGHGIWLLHPDSQYKLVFTLFIIGCLDVSDTQ